MPLNLNLTELNEQREKIHAEQQALLKRVFDEKREWKPEEKEQYDKLETDYEACDGEAKKVEEYQKRQEVLLNRAERHKASGTQLDDEGRPLGRNKPGDKGREGDVTDEHRALALQAWCRSQSGMEIEERHQEACKLVGVNPRQKLYKFKRGKRAAHSIGELRSAEFRALGVGTDTAGGYTVPEDFLRELEIAQLAFGGMMQVARKLRTDSGADLPIPTTNDTSNKGAILAENTATGEQDVLFGQVVMGAYKYTSKMVKVAQELMEDSAFEMASFLGGALGERLARIKNEHCTTGTGASQPRGAVTGSFLGKTAASATAITDLELTDLIHSLNPAYRAQAVLMWHDNTLKAVKKLVDSQGRRLWQPNLAAGEPATFDSYQYVINQDMPAMTTGQKTILFGNFSKYIIREVRGMRLKRLDERYAEADQVAFVAFERFDGEIVDAGTHPIVHLIQA